MRYGIFSDVHSNLEALEAVLAAYKQEGIDKYLCVGDIVGYAANPCQCLKKVREIVSVCVAGNHDWAAIGKFKTDNFNPLAKTAVIKNATQLSQEDKQYLNNLQLVFENEDLTLVHGTLQDAENFHYLTSEFEAIWTARLMESNICFVGHTHKAGIFEFRRDCSVCELFTPLAPLETKSLTGLEKTTDGENSLTGFTTSFKMKNENKYIVNVGGVGQPRDGDSRASYCVFDTDKKEISIKRCDYDIRGAQKKIIEAGLPQFLAMRLSFGK